MIRWNDVCTQWKRIKLLINIVLRTEIPDHSPSAGTLPNNKLSELPIFQDFDLEIDLEIDLQ